MAPLWSWVGALLALPLALAGNHGDAVPKSYIVEFRAFTLLDDDDETVVAKKISSLPYVKDVSSVRELHSPQHRVSTASDASSPKGRANHPKRRSMDYAIGSNDIPHHMTGVDKLRREGYLGSGLRVAVVDSGIDYKHPVLGGCFGGGYLVAFGHNLMDNIDDPYDDCDGHGIHISGLITERYYRIVLPDDNGVNRAGL